MKYLGDNKIKSYQWFIIILALIIITLFIVYWFFNKTLNNIVIIISSVTLFLIISYLYSKVYCICYNKNYFFISNIYKEKKELTEDFTRIEKIWLFPFLLRIRFKRNSYFFLTQSSNTLKVILPYQKVSLADELTLKIKKELGSFYE